MLLGVGNAAVEVVPINQIKHLLEHIPLLLLQLTGILTATQNEHQVVPFPQHRRIAKGLQQGWDVLAAHRPGNRQKRWLVGIPEEGCEHPIQLNLLRC